MLRPSRAPSASLSVLVGSLIAAAALAVAGSKHAVRCSPATSPRAQDLDAEYRRDRGAVLAGALAEELQDLGLRGEAAALARPCSRWLRRRWSRAGSNQADLRVHRQREGAAKLIRLVAGVGWTGPRRLGRRSRVTGRLESQLMPVTMSSPPRAVTGTAHARRADDGHQHRVVYVDRDPEFFARLAAGGFRNVSPSISITWA